MEQNEDTKSKILTTLKTGVTTIARIVLGILIAIQINAWNGERKRVNFEKEILTQIRKNLQQDSFMLAWHSTNAKNAVESGNKVLALDPSTPNDSIQYWLADVVYFDRFQCLTNGFEVLKSKGLGNVSNKQLCFMFGAYYDDQSKLITKGLEDVEWLFTNEWLGLIRKNIVDFVFSKHLILEDYSSFVERGEERNLLKMGIENWRGSAHSINDGLISIQKMMAIIDEEIK